MQQYILSSFGAMALLKWAYHVAPQIVIVQKHSTRFKLVQQVKNWCHRFGSWRKLQTFKFNEIPRTWCCKTAFVCNGTLKSASTIRKLFTKTRFDGSIHLNICIAAASRHHCAIAMWHGRLAVGPPTGSINLNWCRIFLHQFLFAQTAPI